MNFDIRIPIGSMFAILGVILTVYGVVSDDEIYRRSLGVNVNLIWGLVMLVFGGVMLALARRKARADRVERPEPSVQPGPSSKRTAVT